MRLLAAIVILLAALDATAEVPFVNWENHPVRALDLSPDGRLLAATHTADARVQLYDVSEGRAVRAGHVMVGLDPVGVRFRTAAELWVVNHISDSVSIVDVASRTVVRTLATGDEPFDVVFAGNRAFVSCSQVNEVWVFDLSNLAAAPSVVKILGEDPRALTVSPDGARVFAAVFESGNGTTILGGGIDSPVGNNGTLAFPPNITRDADTPYGGENPPRNAPGGFEPPLNPELPPAPEVGLIVRKTAPGQWVDDNSSDWSAFVSGPNAARSGRVPGWDLPDRDIAVIDSGTLAVAYVRGLMNIGMALAVNPASDELTLVGTEAFNEFRFEPVVNGRFVRSQLARVSLDGLTTVGVSDLNTHLSYEVRTIDQSQRDQSIGDPRAIVWEADGTRGFVAGMGSNNVIVLSASGARAGVPIEVGEGPAGLALDEARERLYVWNHFEASLSTIALDDGLPREIDRLAAFDPLPEAIRAGRPFLYDTHRTSGLGHVSCASCHVDGRMDRLAWDLGDPAGEMKAFNQNCGTDIDPDTPCEDFHPMKGPMTTQTLQDIIGHEPFHWRGDRDGIEEFNGAFTGLLSDDRPLTDGEMQRFEDFLATIVFPPNPFRQLDNALPDALPLDGHFTTGRFGPAGQPLGTGNARRGLELYTGDFLDSPFQCSSCHTLPTGMGVNGPLLLGTGILRAGGETMPDGPLGENHLSVVSVDGSTNRAIKVPHLRNMYDKVGFETTQADNLAGFGFLHDGSVDSLARFVSEPAFSVQSDQDVADLVALMLAFAGSDFGEDPTPLSVPAPRSKDTHAAVGVQVTVAGAAPGRLGVLVSLAQAGAIDLVAHRGREGWRYDGAEGGFAAADGSIVAVDDLVADATNGPITVTAVPAGLGARLATDRDGDGLTDMLELSQGSNPADAGSTALTPRAGLWFNPARSGHGLDVQRLGDFLFATWYTYEDDGTPTWYQASGPFAGETWSGEMNRFTWNPETGFVDIETVGELGLTFEDATHARFDWRLGERTGSEPFELLVASTATTLRDYTGTWYDEGEPGWGLTLYSQGAERVGVLYFYDADNQPRWALGQGGNDLAGELAMFRFAGFCPDCDRIEPQAVSAGALDLVFDSERSGVVTSTVVYPDLADSGWPRTGVAIVPLSDPYLDVAGF
ncbi:MAG: hypothetical protein AAGE01_11340 [Pseudomonadota bacterium]